MKSTFKAVAVAGALVFAGENIAKAVYSADIAIDPNIVGQGVFAAPSVLAPVGTIIWYVASTTDANLGTFGVNTTILPNELLGSDDIVVSQTRIDGDLFQGGIGAGNLIHTVEGINDSYSSRPIFMVVFSSRVNSDFGQTLPIITPGAGDVFGFANLGVNPNPFPSPGNANWNPDGLVIGNTHLIAVPEPSTYLLGMVGLAGLVGYRRMRR